MDKRCISFISDLYSVLIEECSGYKKQIYFLILSCLLLSCSSTKRVEEGEYLVTSNKIRYEESPHFEKGIAYNYLKLKPNNKIMGFPLGLTLFNATNQDYIEPISDYQKLTTKNKDSVKSIINRYGISKNRMLFFWNKLKYNNSEKPILLDSNLVNLSANQLTKFMKSKGYLNAKSKYEIEVKNKKAYIKYIITPKKPYIIDSFKTIIYSPVIDSIYRNSISNSKIKNGQPYDASVFNDEADRLNSLIRSNGFYNFNRQYIHYEIDTNQTNHSAITKLYIEDRLKEMEDTIARVPHEKTYVQKVKVFTDFDNSSRNQLAKDSIVTPRQTFVWKKNMEYKPEFLNSKIQIEPNQVFNEKKIENTYKLLGGLNNFRSLNIRNTLLKNDSLLIELFLTPQKKHSLLLDLENTYSQNFGFGIGSKIGYLTRNIFGGGENLTFSANMNLRTIETGDETRNYFFNAKEFGVQANLKFPYLWIPFNKKFKTTSNDLTPETTILLGATTQSNIGLGKINLNANIDYTWYPNRYVSHSVKPLYFNFVQNKNKEEYFTFYPNEQTKINNIIESIQGQDPNFEPTNVSEIQTYLDQNAAYTTNPENLSIITDFDRTLFNQVRISRDYLYLGANYTFTYSEINDENKKNPLYLRLHAESSGLGLSLFNSRFKTTTEGNKQVFGVDYAQFLKAEIDIRKFHSFSESDHNIATRFFVGAVIPYGNSEGITPFDKAYFAGGSNDIRAWRPYELISYSDNSSFIHFDGLKILASIEYRLPVTSMLKTAFFIDAGNIFNIDGTDQKGRFAIGDFYKKLGLGGGIGTRFDFSIFLARLDFAYKFFDPSDEDGWVLKNQKIFKPTVQFSIGYPF